MLRIARTFLMMAAVVFFLNGCQVSKTMPVESKFSKVSVGEMTSDQLLDMLSGEKVLQTTGKISVFNKSGKFKREFAIASAASDSSVIERFIYMSRAKDFSDINMRVIISTKVGPEVLLKPYESDADKKLAIVRYCHEMLRKDSMEFANEQESHDLMNFASMLMGLGVAKLEQSPRDVADISTDKGFTYVHTTAGECKIRLENEEGSDIYTVSVYTKSGFDWMVKW